MDTSQTMTWCLSYLFFPNLEISISKKNRTRLLSSNILITFPQTKDEESTRFEFMGTRSEVWESVLIHVYFSFPIH